MLGIMIHAKRHARTRSLLARFVHASTIYSTVCPYADGIRIRAHSCRTRARCPKYETVIRRFDARRRFTRARMRPRQMRIDTLRFRSKTRADLRSTRRHDACNPRLFTPHFPFIWRITISPVIVEPTPRHPGCPESVESLH